MLEIRDLCKTYKSKNGLTHAVSHINLKFDHGEFVSILGESGSGKTTLLSILGGMEKPTSGSIIIDGMDMDKIREGTWTRYRKSAIGFVFQDFNLIDHLSALDNVQIALSLSGHSEKYIHERAKKLLEQVGMYEHRNHFPKELSGGQQQRVAIARALANKPDVILADEPTGALDPDTSEQILELLQDLSRHGHIVIMVTHDGDLAEKFSTRVVEISSGIITRDSAQGKQTSDASKPLQLSRSRLSLKSTMKLARNNLYKRKKSSLLAISALVPSLVLIMIMSNLIVNMYNYRSDIDPIAQIIMGDPSTPKISLFSENAFESQLRGTASFIDNINSFEEEDSMFTAVSSKSSGSSSEAESTFTRIPSTLQKRLNTLNTLTENLWQPYSAEDIAAMIKHDKIEAVFEHAYFHVNYGYDQFVIKSILPYEYRHLQTDIPASSYPQNWQEGILLSRDLATKIWDDPENHIGESLEFTLTSCQTMPLHIKVYQDKRHRINLKVLDIIDTQSNTQLTKDYYSGYIFMPHHSAQTLKQQFDQRDLSFFSLSPTLNDHYLTPGFAINGFQRMSDVLEPLRPRYQDTTQKRLIDFEKFYDMTPSGNYMLKHTLIVNEPFTKEDLIALRRFGVVTPSFFSEQDAVSMKAVMAKIDENIETGILVICLTLLVPSLLILIILYISIMLRHKEIGILKAIGAKSGNIVVVFMLESGQLAFYAGLIAIGITIPILMTFKNVLAEKFLLNDVTDLNPFALNPVGVMVGLVISLGLYTILGALPGRKAGKLQPKILLRRIS